MPNFGPFTSNHRVTFIGDTHPVFHGSVVKAIASAMRTYPHILKSLGSRDNLDDYATFRAQMQALLTAQVTKVQRHPQGVVELQIRAPQVAKKVRPGEFFRLQNFATYASVVGNTRLQTEAMAMLCGGVERENITLWVLEQGVSSRLAATFRVGEPVVLMGPTGVRAKIPGGGETVMIIGGRLAMASLHFLGKGLREAHNRVLYIASLQTAAEVYAQEVLEAVTDAIVWVTAQGHPVPVGRPQDYAATGDLLSVLMDYAKSEPAIALNEVTRVSIIGNSSLIKTLQAARQGVLQTYLTHNPAFTATVYGPMQCMLKGVCAQCLQWQVDVLTGKRTKAVFACSWQEQPLEMIDVENIEERLCQNRLQEHLSNLWLEYLLAKKNGTPRK